MSNDSTQPGPETTTTNTWTPLSALRRILELPAERLTLPAGMVRVAKSTLKLVALALVVHAESGSGVAWPSVQTIADRACISERQARYALRALEHLRVIRRAPEAAKRPDRARRQGRYTPTFYRVVPGRVALARGGKDAPRIQALKVAYASELEARHKTRFVPPTGSDTWKQMAAPIASLAELYAEPFEQTARRVMRAFMRRDDDRLVHACHPPAFLLRHLGAIDSQLRTRFERETYEQQGSGGAVAVGADTSPLSAEQTKRLARLTQQAFSAVGAPKPRRC